MSYRFVVRKTVWHIPLLCVQCTPDDGHRNCPKHVDFHSRNTNVEKLVHLVGSIIRNLSRCMVTWTSTWAYGFIFIVCLVVGSSQREIMGWIWVMAYIFLNFYSPNFTLKFIFIFCSFSQMTDSWKYFECFIAHKDFCWWFSVLDMIVF